MHVSEASSVSMRWERSTLREKNKGRKIRSCFDHCRYLQTTEAPLSRKWLSNELLRTSRNQDCSRSHSMAITTHTQLWHYQALDKRISAMTAPDRSHAPGLQETDLSIKPMLDTSSFQISWEWVSSSESTSHVAARETGKCNF